MGRAISPSSFTHEVVLVKFEMQTHMEYLSSCRSGVLVVFVLLNLQFQCIRNFLSAIKYLSFCFVIPVYVFCLFVATTFPFDAGSRVDNVRHTSGYFFMLNIASKGNIVGMIRQMTTAF